MELIAHNPPDGRALGSYSQSVEVRNATRTLYISGQVPEAADGVFPDDFEAQCLEIEAIAVA